ncbi:MAG: RdgB/HAM1 family non-canonical purine NTP pyrophosphatase [Lentisphaeria bacterium]
MEILVATGNKHKVEEIQAILGEFGIKVLSFRDLNQVVPEVVEDADSFHGNAAKKAIEMAIFTKKLCLADDSGLEVEALGGAPGVYSARFAGENATDRENLDKLLQLMEGQANRKARFVSSIVLANSDGIIASSEGYVYGKIFQGSIGSAGFGYDPCFIPDGYDATFAQLGSEVKDKISHRSNALKQMVESGIFSELIK